jgi:hypothetical protein
MDKLKEIIEACEAVGARGVGPLLHTSVRSLGASAPIRWTAAGPPHERKEHAMADAELFSLAAYLQPLAQFVSEFAAAACADDGRCLSGIIQVQDAWDTLYAALDAGAGEGEG